MKKMISVLLAVLMMAAFAAASAEQVDTYSSASLTKSYVEGDDAKALAEILAVSGADIATKAQTEAPDYVREYGLHVLIISTNPDGCPGMSTIGYWHYVNNRAGAENVNIIAGDWEFNSRGDGRDQVVAQLTEGQNALNLFDEGIGGRASIVVKLEDGVYTLHLSTTEIFEQKFTQEAYDAGEFASGYSGADRQASSFYFVFDVLSIEKSNQILF